MQPRDPSGIIDWSMGDVTGRASEDQDVDIEVNLKTEGREAQLNDL